MQKLLVSLLSPHNIYLCPFLRCSQSILGGKPCPLAHNIPLDLLLQLCMAMRTSFWPMRSRWKCGRQYLGKSLKEKGSILLSPFVAGWNVGKMASI